MLHLIKQLEFNFQFALKLTEDLSESQMKHCPGPGLENHPAFTLGHLTGARAMVIEYLGEKSDLPELWDQLFRRNGPGDPRLPELLEQYPTKQELLQQWIKQHKHCIEVVQNCSPHELEQEQDWRFSGYFPSKLDCTSFMIINHESMHLGQLSAWRRAMKLNSGLNAL